LQTVGDEARDDVGRAAGWKAVDDRDRARRPLFRESMVGREGGSAGEPAHHRPAREFLGHGVAPECLVVAARILL
jgi:hypothetical protein